MQPGDQLSQYRMLSLLGVGGMGEVWKALDCGLAQREVAVKVVSPGADPDFLEALASEARTLAKTPLHKNLVVLFGVVETEGQVALVMEYIPGAPLTALLRAHPKGLPWPLACLVLQGIFEGVAHAHRHRVIHRDLKPDNIRIANYQVGRPFLSDDIKILDFGLARVEKAMMTRFTRSAAGTLTYMSPEQLREERQGTYTDVYALGVVAYEILIGHPPFGGPGQDSFSALVQAHCELAPPSPALARRGLAGPLEQALLKAMEKDPARRFASAEDMGEAILPLIRANALAPDLREGSSKHLETMDLHAGPPSSESASDRRTRDLTESTAGPEAAGTQPNDGKAPGGGPLWLEVRKATLAFLTVLVVGGGLGLYLLRKEHAGARTGVPAQFPLPDLCFVRGGVETSINWPSVPIASFSLARTPVTIAQFRAFVAATGYDAGKDWDRPGLEQHPVASISYLDAEAYVSWLCRITGSAWFLPSAAEYEFAASNRGQNLRYPWGNRWSPDHAMANLGWAGKAGGAAKTMPVGSYPANELGLQDLVGNIWTWTSTRNEEGSCRVTGGCWENEPETFSLTQFGTKAPTTRNERIGFRVAQR